MAVTLKVLGSGSIKGSPTNITGYSVSEDATPAIIGDSSGGVGGLSLGVVESHDARFLLGSDIELIDQSNGRTVGTVSTTGGGEGLLDLTADSRMNKLVVERVTAPFSGTLPEAFLYYLSLGGITTGIVIDPALSVNMVTATALEGDLWLIIKQLCVAYEVEIALVSNIIIVRPLRMRTLYPGKVISASWDNSLRDMAREVTVTAQNNEMLYAAMIELGDGDKATTHSVEAGESLTTTIKVNASLISIEQPIPVLSVPHDYAGQSVYSIVDKDDLEVSPDDWLSANGLVSVSISEEFGEIDLYVIGASIPERGPFKLATAIHTFEEKDVYSSLRLRGSGVFFNPEEVSVITGSLDDGGLEDVGASIDNPFINSQASAISLGVGAAQQYAGPEQTLQLTATVLNRKNDRGTANTPTFDVFNALYDTQTFTDFNTLWASKTYTEFNQYIDGLVQDTFENQAFGNIAGARIEYYDIMYRVRSATISEEGISLSGEADTTFSDFNARWAGKTFDDFNVRWDGRTYREFGVMPLWV